MAPRTNVNGREDGGEVSRMSEHGEETPEGYEPEAAPSSRVFVHLSDLHFRQAGTPLAHREAMLRNRLLEDIPDAVAMTNASEVTAILITGDIARAGQASEYLEARIWLELLCERLNLDETQRLTCPGNHDVDRNSLTPDRLERNAELRACHPHLLDAEIDRMLADPEEVLAPLGSYQEFAAATACDIEKFLAWELPPLPLAGGYSLVIRGASSVVNSDGADGAGTMAVQRNQLQVEREPGVVNLLLIHHSPYFWRRPNPTPGRCGNHIVLYGHTHEPNHQVLDGTCIEITAGAVHPEETEMFAIPSYNVVEVSIDEPDDPISEEALARVRVFHRSFSMHDDQFLGTGPVPTIEETVKIIRSTALHPAGLEGKDGMLNAAEPQPPLQTGSGTPVPSRLVLARYQRLGLGDRLRLLDRLGIPRHEITALPPHRQIREVARRIVSSDRVEEFLAAVAEVEGGRFPPGGTQ